MSALPGTQRGTFSIALIACSILISIAYVININGQSTTGFVLRQREQARVQAAREVQDLEQELSILSSTGMIETAARSMDLVSVGDAEYAAPETGVAVSASAVLP